MNRFDISDTSKPLIVAPMAGGPSTPQLAAAASNAGGLGMLAGGLLRPDVLAERIDVARRLTSGPVGVNLFVPQPSAGTYRQYAEYAKALAPEAERYDVQVGAPRDDDDGWADKLAVVSDMRPALVSFTFGLPTEQTCSRLQGSGIPLFASVTTPAEAKMAVARGVDALIVQGPAAGGHRATFDPAAPPCDTPLPALLKEICADVDVPVVASGGLATAEDVAQVLAAGAVAAQLGTAFLLADEAGTHPTHRAALHDRAFDETIVTRAFTGRHARALRNGFVDRYGEQAPFGFPQIGMMTAPLQKAAAEADDPHGMAMWAGTRFRQARKGSVAEIFSSLT
ncbi:MAG TPA: nitronate monooxygenase [Mycobacterium sp.]|nr:nitronate monooxygenase [Mycobacterium sp.]